MREQLSNLGTKIRSRRELLGLLQSQLATLTQVSVRTIQLIESGKGNPSLETVFKLIQPIGLKLELIVRLPEKNKNQ